MDSNPLEWTVIQAGRHAPRSAEEEIARLRRENDLLRLGQARALHYVRAKVDQLLRVMGTVPLRSEELDDDGLLDLDPIGIVAESFGQVLRHLQETHDELRMAHGELHAIFDSAGVGIVVLDPEQRILALNRTAQQSLARSGQAPLGRRCFEAICGREEPRAECTFRRAVAGGGTIRREGWVHGDRHYDVMATPLFGRDGALAQVILVYVDITERLNALSALAESEDRYRDLCENANDMIQSVRPDGVVLYVNRAWLQTLGYSAEEVAQGISLFQIVASESREHCERLFRGLMAAPGECHIHATFLAKDGRRVVVEGSANSRFVDGAPVASRAILRDVTERTRMEVEAARAQQLESLGVLAGGIAHDFNNLLTAILGNVSLARAAGDPEGTATARLREAEKATLRARDLTHQLLTFARGGAPVREEVSVAQVLRDAVGFALSGSRARCDLQMPEDLWSAELDASQVGQVVQNLVLNADQSMPDGGTVRVAAENLPVGQESSLPLSPGPHIRVTVADHGVGILPAVAPRIFDPYFTTKSTGSGLGLTTAYSIVRRHGGHISFDSKPGEGTTFFVFLPATGRTLAPPVADGERPPAGKGRVLVMDDDEMVRDAAGAMLEFLGYTVDKAAEGGEAVDRYRRALASGTPYDAVIVDLTVPGGMGGKEAAQRLLELDPGARVIASSGYSNDPVMASFRDFGFWAVAAKPYRMDTLAGVLQEVTER